MPIQLGWLESYAVYIGSHRFRENLAVPSLNRPRRRLEPDSFTHEEVTNMASRNVDNNLPTYAA